MPVGHRFHFVRRPGPLISGQHTQKQHRIKKNHLFQKEVLTFEAHWKNLVLKRNPTPVRSAFSTAIRKTDATSPI